MYSEELETLIEAAIANGDLGEKEKQVLFKKAQAEGVDLDEFEIILNSRVAKLKKGKEKEADLAAPKSNKIGDVKKCPACGALVPPYHSSCPECGFQFNDVGTSQTVENFVEKLDAMESNRVAVEQQGEVQQKGCWYYVFILYHIYVKAFKLLWNVLRTNTGAKPKEWDNTDKRKEEFIMNYPIPISFGEMIEFLTLANSKVKPLNIAELFSKNSGYEMEWNKIWIKKIDQIESKAKIAMKNDPTMLDQVTAICQQAKETEAKNLKTSKIVAFSAVGAMILLIVLLIIIF